MLINKDLAAGLLFLALGVAGLYVGADYAFGTTARMGPGFVPKLLCWGLVVLGCVITLVGFMAGGEAMDRWAVGPLMVILTAVLVFGAYLEPFGLEGATIGAVLLASTGRVPQGRVQLMLLAVAIVLLGMALLPGVARKLWPLLAMSLLPGAGLAILAQIAISAHSETVRAMVEQATLAIVLAMLAVVVFVDALGLTFRSIFVMDLWLPVKTNLVQPVAQFIRGLVQAVTGI